MSLPRVVPWRDWAEWQAVYAGLYANDPAPRMRAVARCRTWRLRGNVPHVDEPGRQARLLRECIQRLGIPARLANIQRAVDGPRDGRGAR